jgi:hypothetical protein
MFALTNRRSDEEFTLNRAASAVREGDGQISGACRKQKLTAQPVPILRTPR